MRTIPAVWSTSKHHIYWAKWHCKLPVMLMRMMVMRKKSRILVRLEMMLVMRMQHRVKQA
jgi:hypothetical protein